MEEIVNKCFWAMIGSGRRSQVEAVLMLPRLPALLDAVIDESNETCGHDDIGDVGRGVNDTLVADPHVRRRHPVAGALVAFNLVWRTGLGDNVSDRSVRDAILNEVEGDDAEIPVEHAAPLIAVSPPLEFIALGTAVTSSRYVDAGIVGEFELHGVGRYGFALWLVLEGQGAVGRVEDRTLVMRHIRLWPHVAG